MMSFYDEQHRFYCGVDLHTKRIYLCILDSEGNKRLHRNVGAKPDDFLGSIKRLHAGVSRCQNRPMGVWSPNQTAEGSP